MAEAQGRESDLERLQGTTRTTRLRWSWALLGARTKLASLYEKKLPPQTRDRKRALLASLDARARGSRGSAWAFAPRYREHTAKRPQQRPISLPLPRTTTAFRASSDCSRVTTGDLPQFYAFGARDARKKPREERHNLLSALAPLTETPKTIARRARSSTRWPLRYPGITASMQESLRPECFEPFCLQTLSIVRNR